MNHDPFVEASWFFAAPYALDLAPTNKSASVHDYLTTFFHHAAEGVRVLKSRARKFTIELFAGDGFAVVDNIRFDSLNKGREFPALYDRLHLSNVPDYTYVSLITQY